MSIILNGSRLFPVNFLIIYALVLNLFISNTIKIKNENTIFKNKLIKGSQGEFFIKTLREYIYV